MESFYGGMPGKAFVIAITSEEYSSEFEEQIPIGEYGLIDNINSDKHGNLYYHNYNNEVVMVGNIAGVAYNPEIIFDNTLRDSYISDEDENGIKQILMDTFILYYKLDDDNKNILYVDIQSEIKVSVDWKDTVTDGISFNISDNDKKDGKLNVNIEIQEPSSTVDEEQPNQGILNVFGKEVTYEIPVNTIGIAGTLEKDEENKIIPPSSAETAGYYVYINTLDDEDDSNNITTYYYWDGMELSEPLGQLGGDRLKPSNVISENVESLLPGGFLLNLEEA